MRHSTFLPKGIRLISTSLKCCLANGMPIMVMKSSTPNTIWLMAVQMPPHSNHIMLNSNERHPVLLLLLTISLPNGASTTAPILKHCSPNGIPPMVRKSPRPPTNYPSALISPPKTSHMILPKKLSGAILNQFAATKYTKS